MKYTSIIYSKDNLKIPVFENNLASHSKYLPKKEAETFAANCNKSDFFIVTGLCGLYHLEALNKRFPKSKIIAVESCIENINFIKKEFANKTILKDILITDTNTLHSFILKNYIPALYSSFSVLEFRNWTNANQKETEDIRQITKLALKEISLDFSVQANFGRIWQKNILENLKLADEFIDLKLPIERKAVIIAAGPSLDNQIKNLKSNRNNLYIISTDTALPSLIKNGIKVDTVCSIDGQLVSYPHFMTKIPKETLFVFDLCANSNAVRKIKNNGNKIIFAVSGHPLSHYAEMTQKKNCFIKLTAGAGTVTIEAVDFALKMGFSEIEVIAADFSYIGGKAYARGTYLDRNFEISNIKNQSYENKFSKLMYRTPLEKKDKNIKTSSILEEYKNSFIEWSKKNNLSYKYEKQTYKIISNVKSEPIKLNLNPFNYSDLKEYINSDIKNLENHEIFFSNNNLFTALLPYISFLKKNKPYEDFNTLLKLAIRAICRYNV